jgi:hypothetical protein
LLMSGRVERRCASGESRFIPSYNRRFLERIVRFDFFSSGPARSAISF